MKKRIIWIAAVLIVVIVAATLFGRGGKSPEVNYETQVIATDTITLSVTATGTVNPVNKVDVGTQVSGIISDIYVDFNSEVEQGQLIAQLDRSTLEAEKSVAEESLCAAELDYKLQKKNFERQRNLFEQSLISDTEYDDAETAYLKAESSYRQAKLSLERAEINLGYTQIYSPISGVVLSRAVDEGQTVASGYSTPTLFTIANDLRQMQVIANVDEADIGAVKEGQRVDFTVDTYTDDTFHGTVRQVRLQSTTTSNVVTYEVVIDAPNPDLKLKPGMTATTTIYTMERGGVFVVPAKALRFVPSDITAQQRKELPAQHVYVRGGDGKSLHAVNTKPSDAEARQQIIRMEGIRRDFRVGSETVHALRGVSFSISEGEFVTIMGTSGSGKSTLLNLLGCLDVPTAGEYYLDGIPVRRMSGNERATLRNRKIGFVFQSYNLLPKTTAVENVELPLLYNSAVGRAERRARAEQALRDVGLQDRMNHRSNQMSGGQQQRVAIARALVNDPVIILADEATGNLDTRTSFEILTLFQRLNAKGRTIIFVTHNPEIALYSSRTITLRDGRIIEDTVNTRIASAAETLAAMPPEE